MPKQWTCKCGQVNEPGDDGFSAHRCSSCRQGAWLKYYLIGGGVAALALLIAFISVMAGAPKSAYRKAYKAAIADGVVDDTERQSLDKIAKRYRLDPGATAAIEKEFQLPVAQNACGLQAVAHPDAQRALEYLKQGMNYASQRKPEAALDEFQQVLKIDPHYLAIQQNIGLQYAALGRYPEAEKAIIRNSIC